MGSAMGGAGLGRLGAVSFVIPATYREIVNIRRVHMVLFPK
jgi:hypothetical protein